MIRIQIFCAKCNQIVDATVGARRGRAIVSAFEDAHLYPECMEEEPHGRQDEGSPGATEAHEGAGPANPDSGAAEGSAPRAKVH